VDDENLGHGERSPSCVMAMLAHFRAARHSRAALGEHDSTVTSAYRFA
jgi:hypothetical protein